MAHTQNSRAWIFVSHASADLRVVRHVRNYLEDRGASPLLFHLRSLTAQDEFWPLIEREILARNFFLYCESEAAEQSEWVQRERAVVASATGPRRIGLVQVDQDSETLDLKALDALIARTRVYQSFVFDDRDAVEPYLAALRAAGFQLFDEGELLTAAADMAEVIKSSIASAANEGWVVAFISRRSMESHFVRHELQLASQLGALFVPVFLEPVAGGPVELRGAKPFNAYEHGSEGPALLAAELLRR